MTTTPQLSSTDSGTAMSSLDDVSHDVARGTRSDGAPGAPRRVVVLGGTGLLGGSIASAFLEAGSQVTIVARRAPHGDRAHALAGASFLGGDAADRAVLRRALRDASLVVDTVGVPPPAASVASPRGQFAAEIPPLLALLDELRHHADTRLMFVSSGGAIYGEPRWLPVSEDAACRPLSPYGEVKLAAERNVELAVVARGLTATVLRVANAYGPHQRAGSGHGIVAALLHAAATGTALQQFGDGGTVRDYVHVEDVAAAAVALASAPHGEGTFNVGTGIGHSIDQVLEVVEAVVGRRIPVERHPARPADVRAVVLDVTRLAGRIDWRPMPLSTGVARTWSALRSMRFAGEDPVAAGA